MAISDEAQAVLCLALLGAALTLFLISTLQLRLSIRALIWLGGAACLAGSLWFGQGALAFLVLTDDVRRPPDESIILQTLSGNVSSVLPFMTPLAGVMAIGGALFGLIALFAFTPGMTLERIVRPMLIALMGVIAGAVLALTIVAVGFGGAPERRVYLSANAIAIDGDTFSVGDVRIRLAGIDSVEHDDPRGDQATRHLQAMLDRGVVTCRVQERLSRNGQPRVRRSFERLIAQCAVSSQTTIDPACEMLRSGLAQHMTFTIRDPDYRRCAPARPPGSN